VLDYSKIPFRSANSTTFHLHRQPSQPPNPRTYPASPTGSSQINTVYFRLPPHSLLLSARSFQVKGCQACKALLPQRDTERLFFGLRKLHSSNTHKSPLQLIQFLQHLPGLIFGINTESTPCTLHLHFQPNDSIDTQSRSPTNFK